MITVSTRIDPSNSNLEILVATPNRPLKSIPVGLSGDVSSASQAALDELSLVTGGLKLSGMVELAEADANEILKQLGLIGSKVLGADVLRNIGRILAEQGDDQITIMLHDDMWLPWELLHDSQTKEAPAVTDFWGCRYRMYRRFAQNPSLSTESNPIIHIKRNRPRIAIVPLYDVSNNTTPEIAGRERLFLQYLGLTGLAETSGPGLPLDPTEWDKSFDYLCSWLGRDDSEIVHFAGLLAANREGVSSNYELLLEKGFPFPVNNPRTPNSKLLLGDAARVVVLNARCDGHRDPQLVLPLVLTLLQAGAAGVVASTYSVPDKSAAAFVEKFYRRFLRGREIGEALRETKHLFVQELNNPMALLYSSYVDSSNPALRLQGKDDQPEGDRSFVSVPGQVSTSSFSPSQRVNILHLSDLHFGPKHRFLSRHYDRSIPSDEVPELSATIVRDIQQLNMKIDAIVISGDISESGEAAEFVWGRTFLDRIIEELGVPIDHIVVVPGNHDIKWSTGEETMLPNHFSNAAYQQFYENLYKMPPKDKRRLYRIAFLPRKNLAILGLDSCVIESSPTRGIGYVGHAQLKMAIDDLNSAIGGRNDCVKIAVLHHHLIPVEDLKTLPAEHQQFSLVMDAPNVLKRLYQEGFAAVLHGHQHQPFYTDIRLRDSKRQSRMAVIGCGSAGASRTELGRVGRNHYGIISISNTKNGIRMTISGRVDDGETSEDFDSDGKDFAVDLGGPLGIVRDLEIVDLENAGLKQSGRSVSDLGIASPHIGQFSETGNPVDQVNRYPVHDINGGVVPQTSSIQELLNQLAGVLASLYPQGSSADRLASSAGLSIVHIERHAKPIDFWYAIVTEAHLQRKLDQLCKTSMKEYSTHEPLLEAYTAYLNWRNAGAGQS